MSLDLRLAGWRRETTRTDQLSRILLPVAIFGFILAACAGLLLFATDARAYAASPLFQAKLVFIALALANAFALRRIDWRGNRSRSRVALAGVASIALWLGAILMGRLVGYLD